MDVRVKAYAKLNLTLGIKGAQGGYHLIDSLVCTVDCFDLIKLKKRKDKLVSVEMHGRGSEGIPPGRNNAQKAAEAYVEAFGTCGADVTIYKNIPIGAGMGGSSADAAGVLRGMSKLYGLGSEKQLKELADSLGSDTGYLLSGGFARITGRGEKVENINSDLRLNFLLLVPKGGVSTAECYKLYDSIGENTQGSENAIKALLSGDTAGLAENMNNALYAPACRLNGGVYTAFCELEEFSPLGVNMTGSGSGVFAVFESAELCAWARSRYRGKFESILLKTKTDKKVIKWPKKD